MRGNYDFVRRLGTEGLEPEELARIRAEALLGSHADIILKEALLDRPYVTETLHARMRSVDPHDYVVSSFPAQFLHGCALSVRSEFLMLRYAGSSTLRLEDGDRWIASTLSDFRPCATPAMIYRLCDYDPNDYEFLPSSEVRADASRGAQRLIDDEALLALDLRMVDAFRGEGIPVEVLVPFVQFPSQLVILREKIERFLGGRSNAPVRIGCTFEVPANLLQARDFEAADFVVFGVNDLLKFLFGGVDRNSKNYRHVDPQLLIAPISAALLELDRLGSRTVYLMKSLIDMSHELPLAECSRTKFHRFYMPNQLAHPVATALP